MGGKKKRKPRWKVLRDRGKRPPTHGGRAVREGRGTLWRFTSDGDGSFTVPDPDLVSALYFPLMNEAGMKCSVTPDFKGNICTSFHQYLSIPVVTEDLHRSNASRNFWVSPENPEKPKDSEPWSATGTGAFAVASRWWARDDAEVHAGPGWFAVERLNRRRRLKAFVTVFVPSAPDTVEVMLVEIESVGKRPADIVATSATPIFGRSADNLRDHRQVTTMFQRIFTDDNGVVVTPNIRHDERGHFPDPTLYAVFGFTGEGGPPVAIWNNLRDFTGEGGSLANPEAVWSGLAAPDPARLWRDGREAIGAMRFAPVTLGRNNRVCYVVLHAIAEDRDTLHSYKEKYGSEEKAVAALEETKGYWRRATGRAAFHTYDPIFDNWMRWVAFQPFCRKIYGNSYLPDFGYGRGGRGWRDLWSDLVALFLLEGGNVTERGREDIVNNFLGVRVDGTNATIVGTKPGEFAADRKHAPRTWCDHGAWPFWVTNFYVDQTGDFDVLFEKLAYWKDHLVARGRGRDELWDESQGTRQLTAGGEVHEGTLLEHVLIELLSSFYHVGEHGNILLEGGDWNDCYDMARRRGESACFTSFYAGDLSLLADLLDFLSEKKGLREVELLTEMVPLLDRLPGGEEVDYASPEAKRARLDVDFQSIRHSVSGEKTRVAASDLAADLRAKGDSFAEHVRRNEWITTADGLSFFNGHYDDDGERVHGDHPNGVRIDLTSQEMPVLCGVATDAQVRTAYKAVRRYLKDPVTGALRLCTDFKELKLNFGRVTAFAFGHREHGSVWSRQNVMYACGLYRRGFVREGREVLRALYGACMDSATSRTFPCIPSCIDPEGRGAYCYLTGSATWLVVTALTQVFGVRGERGDLRIEPKLVKEQFGWKGRAEVQCEFAGRQLKVIYLNRERREWGGYGVGRVTLNGARLDLERGGSARSVLIPRNEILALAHEGVNDIEVTLE